MIYSDDYVVRFADSISRGDIRMWLNWDIRFFHWFSIVRISNWRCLFICLLDEGWNFRKFKIIPHLWKSTFDSCFPRLFQVRVKVLSFDNNFCCEITNDARCINFRIYLRVKLLENYIGEYFFANCERVEISRIAILKALEKNILQEQLR